MTGVLLPIAVFAQKEEKLPNLVLIFMDDQGYADVGCFSNGNAPTPNIDRLAKEGMRMTNFYDGANVSSPSRACLMTGCYAPRVSIPAVLQPYDSIGLNTQEVTIAKLLKQQGYKSACIGKWHLGHMKGSLPTNHGFDQFIGLLASNNMSDRVYRGETLNPIQPGNKFLTQFLTEESIKFIESNKSNPFFLYLAHPMPHIPLGVSPAFEGKSGKGLYSDVLMEIDWSVGKVVETLKKNNLFDNTIIIVTSDNGPWLVFGDHAGSAFPFREGKTTTFEGGHHQFCIITWGDKIKKGSVCDQVTSNIDFFPTMAAITGAELPETTIDGENILPLLLSEEKNNNWDRYFYFFSGNRIEAIRAGKWKLILPHGYVTVDVPGIGGKIGSHKKSKIGLSLFDLNADPAEKTNLADKYPEVVSQLRTAIMNKQKEIDENKRPAQKFTEKLLLNTRTPPK